MGATLRYAKIVDRDQFQAQGGQVHPRTDSVVRLAGDEPGAAQPFLVLRAWDHVDTAFTETWRILDPHGRTVHDDVSRTVMAAEGDLADEIADQHFEYADAGYQLVLEVEGREVARADFPVATRFS